MTTPTQALIGNLRNELTDAFPERTNVIDGALAAVLSREHVLLLGPPGTAKSAVTRALAAAFSCVYFEQLVTKFSTPEELFGPISLKALEQDRFTRVVSGKLPTAEIAFIDEIFKANSAILNSMLAVINERVYHNDGTALSCPLVTCFGASNELPDGKELEALFDRFLLRYDVAYLARDENMRSILTAGDPKATTKLKAHELRQAHAEVDSVKVTDATVDALLAIRAALKAEGIIVSDRRWKKALKLCKAFAWLAGQAETSPEDLMCLTDSLWREPKERAKVGKVVGSIADPTAAKVVEILDAAREQADKLAAIRSTDRQRYITDGAAALAQFDSQAKALAKLAASAGKRASIVLADATAEVKAMRADVARSLAAGIGI